MSAIKKYYQSLKWVDIMKSLYMFTSVNISSYLENSVTQQITNEKASRQRVGKLFKYIH